MTLTFRIHTVLLLSTLFFVSGCYTHMQTTERESDAGYYETGQQKVPERYTDIENREDEAVNTEEYVAGDKSGWIDADVAYFVDEESRNWYLEHGISLAYGHSYPYRAGYRQVYDPNWFFSPYAYYTYEGEYFIVPGLRNPYSNYFGGWKPWRNIGYNHLYAYYNYRPLFFWGRLNYDYYGGLYYSPHIFAGYQKGWNSYNNRITAEARVHNDDREYNFTSNPRIIRPVDDRLGSVRTEILRNRILHRDFERVQRDAARVNLTERRAEEYRERLERNRAARKMHLNAGRSTFSTRRSEAGGNRSGSVERRSSGHVSSGSSSGRSRSGTSTTRENNN
ncbi:hypothetical protein [Rhodohalobacter mucosus]|uniref:Uncharacterized protein n=1 Tax=Rhodohalobacter mucosus TaxID=2079485 RepID=A0A316TUU7_9BACT|nr:hypothetical protein [Rhodohalobacter mucosus]PWN06855.1 hypothetical protein DDZ15_06155 [Rhodohalobacter mucosus]